ncbi:tyrosine phosphatase family protein [Pyxidicoccus xibeiensis]|uniref:tyrosine phosphatase family protein n=1 Tax=Pyxidicoccus xibeiensis TaxID=2906759 RepID=UPI0020A7306C|nr:hypothetical protein [Pyxidicoccus xibeiensis]MCP3143079.1 hypothetical protein [Pyxidicoccus xibeiensis]
MGSEPDTLPVIEILPRGQAVKRLMSRTPGKEVGCLVSIGDPGQRHPVGFLRAEHRLRLLFHDVTEDSESYSAPTAEDVARIIQFARGHLGTTRKVLVHCEAGISRSTASATILYAVWLGPGREAEAVERVFQAVPEARPNATLIRLADAQLERGGALIDAVARRLAAAESLRP